jgi:SnoaL-like domain
VSARLDAARGFVKAVQEKDAEAATTYCADDIEVSLPMVAGPFRGKDGVRQMIRMAPSELVQTPRGDEERDGVVRVTTLTRAPGIFANYTTWVFEFDESDHVRRLTFEFRAAN